MESLLRKFASDQRGQTTVEYLMLMAVTFTVAYFIITAGPLPAFTTKMITDIRTRLGNVVRNAEMESKGVEPGTPEHPSDPARLRPLHL